MDFSGIHLNPLESSWNWWGDIKDLENLMIAQTYSLTTPQILQNCNIKMHNGQNLPPHYANNQFRALIQLVASRLAQNPYFRTMENMHYLQLAINTASRTQKPLFTHQKMSLTKKIHLQK